MNASQKLEKVLARSEEAAAALRRSALAYAATTDGSWQREQQDAELARRARQYANAIAAVRRAVRSKP